MAEYQISPIANRDYPWLSNFLTEHWGSNMMVTRNRIHAVDKLPGFVARIRDEPVGLWMQPLQTNAIVCG